MNMPCTSLHIWNSVVTHSKPRVSNKFDMVILASDCAFLFAWRAVPQNHHDPWCFVSISHTSGIGNTLT